MYTTFRRLFLFYTVFISLFISQQILAKTTDINDRRLKNIVNEQLISNGDLIYDLQIVDPDRLANDVNKLRSILVQDQQQLTEQVKNKQFDIGDAIITLIVPGGLLYAGYRINELEQIKNKILKMTTEINDYSDDIIALQGSNTDKSYN